MDGFLQRILDMVNNSAFVNLAPDRRAQKMALVNTLAGMDKERAKSTPLNRLKALKFKRGDDAPKDTDHKANEETVTRRRGLSRRRDPNKSEGQPCKEDVKRMNSVQVEIHASQKDTDENSFEEDLLSNLTRPSVSVTNLLEEIEADLPSSYSLTNVLDHTFHSVTNLRTWARLSRVGMNCVQVEGNVKNTQIAESNQANEIKKLQKEAYIQKSLIEQADKAVNLCKVRKKNLDAEDVESVRVLLMAKLRYEAINLELQKITFSGGEKQRDENSGELEISDVWFTVSNTEYYEKDHFVCIAYHKENLFASHIQSEIVDGKLQFPVNFKFNDLQHNFIIYLELYQLNCNGKSKKERMKVLNLNKIMKMTGNTVKREERDFDCIGSGAIRIGEIKCREKTKVSADFHTNYYSAFGKTVFLNVRTTLVLNSTVLGFLDLFKDRYWQRLWCCMEGYALKFWCYPEDKDHKKAPVESVLLPHCQKVQPVSMDICIRPHSFMITYKENEKGILLSACSHRDMMNWINYLRASIRAFEAWAPDF